MIHQYKLNGFNIVLDVCSGSVHVVDDVAYDIIAEFENKEKSLIIAEMLEKYASEEVNEADVLECYAQIEDLKANGKLFAPDTFEPMANKLKEKTAGVVKALCLISRTLAILTVLIALLHRANITVIELL